LSSSNSSTDVFPGKRWKVIERCGKEKWEGIWKREDQHLQGAMELLYRRGLATQRIRKPDRTEKLR
jgi:hypothetical protein